MEISTQHITHSFAIDVVYKIIIQNHKNHIDVLQKQIGTNQEWGTTTQNVNKTSLHIQTTEHAIVV